MTADQDLDPVIEGRSGAAAHLVEAIVVTAITEASGVMTVGTNRGRG